MPSYLKSHNYIPRPTREFMFFQKSRRNHGFYRNKNFLLHKFGIRTSHSLLTMTQNAETGICCSQACHKVDINPIEIARGRFTRFYCPKGRDCLLQV